MAKSRKNSAILAFLCVGILLIGLYTASGKTNYLKSDGWPILKVTNVSLPKEESQPLKLTFEFATSGTNPLAIAEKDFGVLLVKGRWSFSGSISLTNNASDIVTAHPDRPVTVTALVWLSKGNGKQKRQIKLDAGTYRIQIFVGSGKLKEFDYQYMGVNHSNQFEFEVK